MGQQLHYWTCQFQLTLSTELTVVFTLPAPRSPDHRFAGFRCLPRLCRAGLVRGDVPLTYSRLGARECRLEL